MKRGTILKNLWAGHETYFIYMGFPAHSCKAEARKTGGLILVNVDGRWDLEKAPMYCHSLRDREHYPIVGHIDLKKLCIDGILQAIEPPKEDDHAAG